MVAGSGTRNSKNASDGAAQRSRAHPPNSQHAPASHSGNEQPSISGK